jgi:kinesin family protein C1
MVLEKAKEFDNEVSSCFESATRSEAVAMAEKEARLQAEADGKQLEIKIAELQADLSVSRDNEAKANAEIDDADNSIKTLQTELQEHVATIEKLEQDIADMQAINTGLEDDIEELQGNLKSATGTATSVGERASALSSENARLSAELSSTQKKLADLEKAQGLGEVATARLSLEKDSAVEAKNSAIAELDRLRIAFEEKERAISKSHAQVDKYHEQLLDSATRMADLQGRYDIVSRERDDTRSSLRATEVDLKRSERELSISAQTLSETISALELSRFNVTKLTTDLDQVKIAFEKQMTDATTQRADLEQKLAVAMGNLSEAQDKLREAASKEAVWSAKESTWASEKALLSSEKARTEEINALLTTDIKTMREALGASEESTSDKLIAANRENVTLKAKANQIPKLTRELESAHSMLEQVRNCLFESEMTRRQLHNQIQELKGNIRVYVRVRPFLPADADPASARALAGVADEDADEFVADPTAAITVSADGTSVEIAPLAPRGTKQGPIGGGLAIRDSKPAKFNFDQVFGQRSQQTDVFDEVSHLVQSALDGYNVCLFSYGQTGSGKTHTMQGGSGDHAGLIPRSVVKILDTAQGMSAAQGWVYTIEASFLEIYNEQIRDLLRVSVPSSDKQGNNSSSLADSLTVHQDGDGNTYVPGLTHIVVDTPEAVDQLMARAAKKRAVAVTNMNAQSSRSHSVFTLHIKGRHEGKGIIVSGSLNLCDLAGSERLSRSGAEGDRKKETQAINKSLSCLADVFTALAKKAPHIPFRNSKLTHLLQKCFKGDGKTLMLVSLSPTMASAQESMCSLRFAAQVSQVELGKPKKRVVEAIETGATAAAPAPISAAASVWAAKANAAVSSGSSLEISDLAGDCAADEEDGEAQGEIDDATGGPVDEDEMEEQLDMHGLSSSCVVKSGGSTLAGMKRPLGMSSSSSNTSILMKKPTGPRPPATSFSASKPSSAAPTQPFSKKPKIGTQTTSFR